MLSAIESFMIDGDLRELPKYQLFLSSQSQIVDNRLSRYLELSNFKSMGMRLLRYMLNRLDIEYMDSQSNNFDRYIYHVSEVARYINGVISRRSKNTVFADLFISHHGELTRELLIPLEDVTAINSLPLDSNNWIDWVNVRSLRLWSHDSDELSLNIRTDAIQYSLQYPTFVIELIDVPALLFKYYIWWHHRRDHEESEYCRDYPTEYFIHRYVILELVWDNLDIWLLRSLSKLVNDEGIPVRHSDLEYDARFARISNYVTSGFDDLRNLLNSIRRSTRPETFFTAPLLINGSINDRARLALDRLPIPELRQYDWLVFLRDYDLVNIIIDVWSVAKQNATRDRLLTKLKLQLDRYKRNKMWTYGSTDHLRKDIETKLNYLIDKVDQFKSK